MMMNDDSSVRLDFFDSGYEKTGLKEPLLEQDDNATKTDPKSVWSLEFYQRYFEVTTDQVIKRFLQAMLPRPGFSFYKQNIQSNPDLYGPFWISVTLVFTVALSGNIGNYLHTPVSEAYHWKYDFHLVSLAATTIFLYTWVMPLIFWGVLRWINNETALPYVDVACLYGYCLACFVPISILWIIQIQWIQWVLITVGAALSGATLITSVISVVGSRNVLLLLAMWFAHMVLCLTLLWNFFPSNSAPVEITTHA